MDALIPLITAMLPALRGEPLMESGYGGEPESGRKGRAEW